MAENDAPCPHVSVSLIYAAPGARWVCDQCGEAFHPVALTCSIPPEVTPGEYPAWNDDGQWL